MDRIIVAIDDGYAQTKVYGMSPDGGAPVKRMFRTSVRSGRLGLKATTGGAIGAYRTEEGEEFTVSDHIEGENTQFDGFHVSTLNRVLIAHALTSAGYGGREVKVITGLPVSDYFLGNGDVDEAKIEEKEANLRKGVEVVSGKNSLADIKEVDVGCQAVSAWIDFMVGDDLKYRRDSKGLTAIVDVGGRTTDIALVVNDAGSPVIDYSKSGTANVGVLDVYKAMTTLVRERFKLKDDFTQATLDEAVRSGTLDVWGETQDVRDLVAEAVRDVQGKVRREIDRKLGSAATLRHVVFVGGGSALLKDVVSSFRNGSLAEDPEFANARGLLKLARTTEGASALA